MEDDQSTPVGEAPGNVPAPRATEGHQCRAGGDARLGKSVAPVQWIEPALVPVSDVEPDLDLEPADLGPTPPLSATSAPVVSPAPPTGHHATLEASAGGRCRRPSSASERIGLLNYALRGFRDDPEHARELLALAAVRAMGPGVTVWIDWLRERYPDAGPRQLAAMSTARFLRRSGGFGPVAGIAAPLVAVSATAGVAALKCRLVLEVAASYGLDPSDPRRAAELLVLLARYPDLQAAESAVGAAARRAEPPPLQPGGVSGPAPETSQFDPRVTRRPAPGWHPEELWSAFTGRQGWRALAADSLWHAAVRSASRLVPGTGLVIAAVTASGSSRRFAERTAAFYRRQATARPVLDAAAPTPGNKHPLEALPRSAACRHLKRGRPEST